MNGSVQLHRPPRRLSAGAGRRSGRQGLAAALLLVSLFPRCGGGPAADCPRIPATQPTEAQRALLEPASDAFRLTPPDSFRVRFSTTQGDFVVEVMRAWAPLGAARFYALARNGFFDGNRFFRVLPGFIVQFGVHAAPAIQRAWDEQPLKDEFLAQSNTRGTLTFATAGPDSRSTQLFISLGDNARLDALGFAPIGRVIDGMDVLDRLHAGYGEGAPMGNGPSQACMLQSGNAYLEQNFPRLDAITRAAIIP
jgi:peptidyl-prolyl cis-trans isomerase A (cyclophilin A)